MNELSILPVSVSMNEIEQLLRSRNIFEDDDCPQMEKIAEAVDSGKSLKEIELAFPHVKSCEICQESVLYLLNNPEHVTVTHRSFIKHASYLAAAALILISAGLLIFNFKTDSDKAAVNPQMIPKGNIDSIRVAVQRGNYQFELSPMDEVETGDALGFFYSSPKEGYLFLYSVDAQKNITRLFPAEESDSARLKSGTNVSLKNGAVVTDGKNCEWLAGAVFDSPVVPADVLGQLQNAKIDIDTCTLKVNFNKARTIYVMPLTRQTKP
ncbi:MAG: DUF4384 domain-containing protein [Deltaproteobacteria bacterium]|nr:DUF4384 domain-containing protein [Deltaproteobacteria bacterium]